MAYLLEQCRRGAQCLLQKAAGSLILYLLLTSHFRGFCKVSSEFSVFAAGNMCSDFQTSTVQLIFSRGNATNTVSMSHFVGTPPPPLGNFMGGPESRSGTKKNQNFGRKKMLRKNIFRPGCPPPPV